MNKCIFISNLTKDPELKVTGTGMAVCKFSVALNDGYGDKKTVSYINCVAFGKTAEVMSQYTHKGSKVAIESHVKTGSYDKQDGTKAYTTDFIVDKIEFLDSKPKTDGVNELEKMFDGDDIFQAVDDSDLEIPF